jgi:hypothetical protein
MDRISTFSAVVPADFANALLNLRCLSWSNAACRSRRCTCIVEFNRLEYACKLRRLFSPKLTFVYGMATTSWTKLFVLAGGGSGGGVVVGGGRRGVVVDGLEGGGVVGICRHGQVNLGVSWSSMHEFEHIAITMSARRRYEPIVPCRPRDRNTSGSPQRLVASEHKQGQHCHAGSRICQNRPARQNIIQKRRLNVGGTVT